MQNVFSNFHEYRRPIFLGIGMGVLVAAAFAAGFFLRDATGVTPRQYALAHRAERVRDDLASHCRIPSTDKKSA